MFVLQSWFIEFPTDPLFFFFTVFLLVILSPPSVAAWTPITAVFEFVLCWMLSGSSLSVNALVFQGLAFSDTFFFCAFMLHTVHSLPEAPPPHPLTPPSHHLFYTVQWRNAPAATVSTVLYAHVSTLDTWLDGHGPGVVETFSSLVPFFLLALYYYYFFFFFCWRWRWLKAVPQVSVIWHKLTARCLKNLEAFVPAT